MNIPAYQTLAGQRYLEGSVAKADVRWRIAVAITTRIFVTSVSRKERIIMWGK